VDAGWSRAHGPQGVDLICAGDQYMTVGYSYHRTKPGDDVCVATVMKKLCEGQAGAHSTCRYGIAPDMDFDRFQRPAAQLWEVVRDVLLA